MSATTRHPDVPGNLLDTGTEGDEPRVMTTVEEARARGEQDAVAARVTDDEGRAPLTVDQAAAWVPAEHREAYLDGAASVLGYRPRIA